MLKMEFELTALTPETAQKLAAFISGFHGVDVKMPAVSVDPAPGADSTVVAIVEDREPVAVTCAFSKLAESVREVEALAADQRGDLQKDAEGLPWDARIHSSSRAFNADGTWRKRRNLDPAVLAEVETELRALMAAPVVPPAPEAVSPEAAFAATVPAIVAAVAAHVIAPPPPATVVAEAPTSTLAPNGTPAATVAPAVAFPELLKLASSAMRENRITPSQLSELTQKHGAANVGMLSARPDLVPQVYADLQGVLNAAG